jgi:prepilin-type N-terminal cleavage/methylation domain-containing protein
MKRKISLLKRCWLKNKRGFTLVEMLIASLILSLVISTVYFTYRTALSNSRDLQEKLELHQTAQGALAMISADLRGACGELTGSKEKMDFVTSHVGSYYRERSIGLAGVEYFVKDGLVKKEKLPEGLAKGLKKEARTTLVSPLITELVFSYFDNSQWSSEWDYKVRRKLPQSVKTYMVVTNLDQQHPKKIRVETIIPVYSGQ